MRDFVRRRQRVGSFDRNVSPSGVRALLLGALDRANGRLYEQSGSHEDFDYFVILHPVDPDAGVSAATIVLPLGSGIAHRGVGDVFAVWRVTCLESPRDRQLRGHAALEVDSEKLHVAIAVHIAVGGEEYFAVGREATHNVRARMPGQPSGGAASDRDGVDIGIAVILGTEGDGLAIRREDRVGFDADIAGETAGILAILISDPKVF